MEELEEERRHGGLGKARIQGSDLHAGRISLLISKILRHTGNGEISEIVSDLTE